ncbi:peroxynitrite isomerase THAP4 [Nematostella vectensis]|uniref:peroxynitrite isomerase THAP4 n=1 Tax=Nematostella vectensis TaxID=45351 RepID=UPI0020770AD1|nr:peroxynitrite isomerase THAP4 [Nematostella vectensis]
MSNSESSPKNLPQVLAPVSWLVGKWEGEGRGEYPTIQPFTYRETVEFNNFGQPNLAFSSKSWNSKTNAPMHFESGFLRIMPSTTKVALMLAQNIGVTELLEGEVEGKVLHLTAQAIGRMSFGKPPAVLKTERVYMLVDENTLEFKQFMETETTPRTQHLQATYKRAQSS